MSELNGLIRVCSSHIRVERLVCLVIWIDLRSSPSSSVYFVLPSDSSTGVASDSVSSIAMSISNPMRAVFKEEGGKGKLDFHV